MSAILLWVRIFSILIMIEHFVEPSLHLTWHHWTFKQMAFPPEDSYTGTLAAFTPGTFCTNSPLHQNRFAPECLLYHKPLTPRAVYTRYLLQQIATNSFDTRHLLRRMPLRPTSSSTRKTCCAKRHLRQEPFDIFWPDKCHTKSSLTPEDFYCTPNRSKQF